jgi:general secretion pathway protein D
MAGDSARSIYNKAQKAEAKQDYEAAYDLYKQLYDKHPDDLKYQVPYERTRFLAGAIKVKRGQKLRDAGKLAEALDQFMRASALDPSNDLALQEARRTQAMIKAQEGGGEGATGPPQAQEEDSLHKRLDTAGGPVELGALSNVPLQALHSTADSKQIYETIGKLAGVNVLFDPDYTSRRLSVDLQGITIQQALDIVALESRTFWRPVTPNTIFVAADTQTKRRELEQNVIKTFYLGNVATPTDLQDVVNAIRTILEVQRIQQIPSQNAIVVRGTPDQLALAQKMIDDIDKSKPEVVVDIVVAQVRRDKVRQMGILPPQNATVNLQGSNTTSTPATNGGSTTTTGGNLNFNNLQHLNSTNYAVTIDPVHAELLFNDSNTKILENPRLRAADGIKASLKIGDRIPIATGSFGTPLGVGTGVGALGVNTQFQYLDVGVNIDITPHVHPDGEVSLKIAMEISNQTGSSSIGGISQPIISRRLVDHEIRLKDGEMNMLGGILEDSIVNNTAGTPGLGQIPILKYLFSQNDKERHTNEVIFLLVPHIVRGQELSPLNRREYDVGTGVGIDLRKMDKGGAKPEPLTRGQNATPPVNPAATGTAAANPAAPGSATNAPLGRPTAPGIAQATPPQQTPAQPQQATDQPAQQAQAQPQPQPQTPLTQPGPVQQNPAQAAAASAVGNPAPDGSGQPAATKPSPGTPAAGPVNLRLDPAALSPGQGSSFAVNVALAGGQDVASVPIQITYDPKVVQFVNVSNGDFLGKDGQPVALVHRDDPKTGSLQVTAQRPPGTLGVSGSGVVFNLMFMAKAKGTGVIAITTPGARNSQNQPLQVMGSQAAVSVQ